MSTLTVEEARTTLVELIYRLKPDEEVILTENGRPVAKLVAVGKSRRELGAQRGSVVYMAPDFDEPMENSARDE